MSLKSPPLNIMRNKEEVLKDPKSFDALNLEVLLDIRELLSKETPVVKKLVARKKKVGRPRKSRSK